MGIMPLRILLTVLLSLSHASVIKAQQRVQRHPSGTVSQSQLIQVQAQSLQFIDGSKVPFAQLYRYGDLRQRVNRSWVVLRHGEVIVAEQLQLTSQGVRIRSLLWEPLLVQWADVRAVIRNVPKVLSARDRLLETVFQDPATDFVIFNKQTRLEAKFMIDDEGRIVFEESRLGRSFVTPFSAVRVCVFGELEEAEFATAMLGFADGSYGSANSVTRNGSRLVWKTSTGVTLTSAEPLLALEGYNVWDHLECLQPLKTDVVYLDETEVLQAVTLPFFEGRLDNQLNEKLASVGLGRNSLGGYLRAGDRFAPHGIGMDSLSRVTFAVPERATSFVADIAIDPVAAKRGSVTFHVFLRGSSGDWKSAYSSGVIRGGDKSQVVRVPLAGSDEISLVVGMADRATVADYANWLDARFILQPSGKN